MELNGFTPVPGLTGPGVYALCHKGQVIYIGKSKSLLSRVYSHRQVWVQRRRGHKLPGHISAKGIQFDEVHIRPCALHEMDQLEIDLINTYKPKMNQQLKTTAKVSIPVELKIGNRIVTLNKPKPPSLIERRV